jgi:hypothetical protein
MPPDVRRPGRQQDEHHAKHDEDLQEPGQHPRGRHIAGVDGHGTRRVYRLAEVSARSSSTAAGSRSRATTKIKYRNTS